MFNRKNLEKLKMSNKAITPIDKYISNNRKKLEPIHYELENIGNSWELTLPSGACLSLASLKDCEAIMNVDYRKTQFRDQTFELLDINTKTLYSNYRVFSDLIEGCHARQREKESRRRHRLVAIPTKRRKVKKLDMRVYDRNF